MTLIPMNIRSNLAKKSDHDMFSSFREEMDTLVDSLFSNMPVLKNFGGNLVDFKVNISETDNDIEVRAELPGLDEKDVDVTLTKDILTIKGEKKAEKEDKSRNYHLVESTYGSFSRSIKLPFETDANQVVATFDKGVLNVTLAKPKQVQSSPKKIEVKKK